MCRSNISPSFLIYNTPNVQISNTLFLHNHPEELQLNISRNTCYFPYNVNVSLFLDNRTTSGGVSLYIDSAPTNVLVDNCTFFNNTARNDSEVVLLRRSNSNGHGGAMNLRLVDSSNGIVCIRNTRFEGNVAEAHAGALAISLGGSATRNRFLVSNSTFEDNRCLIEKCTGGAVGITFLSETLFNTLLFLDSNFTGNQAQSSGAMVLSTSVSAEQEDGVSDSLTLNNCWFVENQAFFEGTALGVFSITHTNLIGIPVEIWGW